MDACYSGSIIKDRPLAGVRVETRKIEEVIKQKRAVFINIKLRANRSIAGKAGRRMVYTLSYRRTRKRSWKGKRIDNNKGFIRIHKTRLDLLPALKCEDSSCGVLAY